jgi:hypothetical protein
MVGKELIQGIPASAPARLQARLSARRLPLGLPLHRVLRYAQKTLALREIPRHLAALVSCGSALHVGPGRSERLSVVVLPERPPSVHRAHPCPTRTSPRPDVSCPHACCQRPSVKVQKLLTGIEAMHLRLRIRNPFHAVSIMDAGSSPFRHLYSGCPGHLLPSWRKVLMSVESDGQPPPWTSYGGLTALTPVRCNSA